MAHSSPESSRESGPVRGRVWIGTSGWSYAHWRGRLYPPGLRRGAWLAHYARHFPTVEINATFYRLPTPQLVEKWAGAVPEGFLFAVKASRIITHMKRLRDVAAPLGEFLAALSPLGSRLGPVLFQLPPGFGPDLARLAAFLALLPEGGEWALEFRHPGWHDEKVRALLAARGVAMVGWDMAGTSHAPAPTARFAYLRFHGTRPRYGGHYGAEGLAPWAARIRRWQEAGHDVFAYFNNDREGAALDDARTLAALLDRKAGGEKT